MAEQVITTGSDTFVSQQFSGSVSAKAAYPVISAATSNRRRVLLQMPVSLPSSAVVLSATLSCTVRGGGWIAPSNVTVQAIGSSWRIAKTNWDNQPGVIGSAVTTSVSGLNGGDTVDLDVTALAQAIVLGQPNYGWRITTNSTDALSFYGFESGSDSWTLTIEYAENPEPPAQLTPQGVISLASWQCQINDQDDIGSIEVQVDPSANPGTAWSSGWVAVTAPVLDLAATDYPGLGDGSTTYWRAAVKTYDGTVSDFSEWAEVTRAVKPTLFVDTPAAGSIKSATPTVTAHLSPAGTDDTRWRVRVLPATSSSSILWDSGTAHQGATLSVQVPRAWKNKTVLAEDTTYRIEVSCLDRPDRVGSYGDPTWIVTTETVLLDADNSETIPEGLAVSQPTNGAPDVLLHFTRSGASPDVFEVQRRDGLGNWKTLPYGIDPDEAMVSANTWEWIDVTATPNTPLVYRVRAVTNGNSSPWSVSQGITAKVAGFWIRSGFGTACLRGRDVDNIKRVDKRTSFSLPYSPEDADIIGAVGLYAADSITLAIDNRTMTLRQDGGGWTSTAQDVDVARQILDQIRLHQERPVQLVWGTVSIPAYVKGLSVAPYSNAEVNKDRTHTVTFGLTQTDDAAATGFGAAYYNVGVYA